MMKFALWLITGMPKVPTVLFPTSSIQNNSFNIVVDPETSYKIYIILCVGEIIVGPKVTLDLSTI